MKKNKQSTRSLTAFLVTWSFLVLTITGLVLYIVPQGRIAYWVHWSLLGLEKEQWGWRKIGNIHAKDRKSNRFLRRTRFSEGCI